jgi:hypothetical protein
VQSGFLCQAVFQDPYYTGEKYLVGRLALKALVARDMYVNLFALFAHSLLAS